MLLDDGEGEGITAASLSTWGILRRNDLKLNHIRADKRDLGGPDRTGWTSMEEIVTCIMILYALFSAAPASSLRCHPVPAADTEPCSRTCKSVRGRAKACASVPVDP